MSEEGVQTVIRWLRASYSGNDLDVREATSLLAGNALQGPAMLTILLELVECNLTDREVRLSAAIQIRKEVKTGNLDPDAQNWLIRRLIDAVLRTSREFKSIRHYLEQSICALTQLSPALIPVPVASLKSILGDAPGASSLLRLLLISILPVQSLRQHLQEFMPLFLKAGTILISHIPCDQERLLDWLNQVRRIFLHLKSGGISKLSEVLKEAECLEMMESFCELMKTDLESLGKMKKRVYGIMETAAECVGSEKSLLEEYRNCYDALARFLYLDIRTYIPPSKALEPLLNASLVFFCELYTYMSQTQTQIEVENLVKYTLLPLFSPTPGDLLTSQNSPKEFVSKYASFCEVEDCGFYLNSAAELLRCIVRAFPWGLGFLFTQLTGKRLDSSSFLCLTIVMEWIGEREELIEALEFYVREVLKSVEELSDLSRCHSIYFLSRYLELDADFDPSDVEAIVSFFTDSAGVLSCKSVSLQACSALGNLFLNPQTIVIMSGFLPVIASSLAQLIPVIRCEGLYESIRVLICEEFDSLGGERVELIEQLVHRVKIEVHRLAVKKQQGKQGSSQVLTKCFSALVAASSKSIPQMTISRLYIEMMGLMDMCKDTPWLKDWMSIVGKCLEKVRDIGPLGEDLIRNLDCFLESVDWDFEAGFEIVNAIMRNHEERLLGYFPRLCWMIQNCVDRTRSMKSKDLCLLVLQSWYHTLALSNSFDPSLSSLLPWVSAGLCPWFESSPLPLWHLHLTNLFLSIAAYDLKSVLSTSESCGIHLQTVIENVSFQAQIPLSAFDRKTLMFGLTRIMRENSDLDISVLALKTLLELYRIPTWEQEAQPALAKKRKREDWEDSDEDGFQVSEEVGDLLENSQMCFSPLLNVAEICHFREELEEVKRASGLKFEGLIGALDSEGRNCLVKTLQMETLEQMERTPRNYLVPKYTN